jgi:hypothetical protein
MEDLFAPGGLELGKLTGHVLRAGRDSIVAINHVAILHQNFA